MPSLGEARHLGVGDTEGWLLDSRYRSLAWGHLPDEPASRDPRLSLCKGKSGVSKVRSWGLGKAGRSPGRTNEEELRPVYSTPQN